MNQDEAPEPAPAETRDVRRRFTLVWSLVMVVLGVAILVRTLANGGGPLALGLVFGVLFVGAGAGRFWLTHRGYL